MKALIFFFGFSFFSFSVSAQITDTKEYSDFVYDFGIVADAIIKNDSLFLSSYDDAIKGYHEKETYWQHWYWEESKKKLETMFKNMAYSNRALDRMKKQLNAWGQCTEMNKDLLELIDYFVVMKSICKELYGNSWGYYSAEAYTLYNQPKGKQFYKYNQLAWDLGEKIQGAINTCLQ